LHDPDGSAEALLAALGQGPCTQAELGERLAAGGRPTPSGALSAALAALDSVLLLDDPDGASLGSSELDERHFSNLAFFQAFGTLDRTPAAMQRRLLGAHVLQLGTGGLGSNVLQGLAGLGVGRLTLLDSDRVEERNFARQFLYRRQDIGRSKVHRAAEWVRDYDGRIEVRAVERWVAGPADVADLLPGVDVVSSGVDQPAEIDQWVNEACVTAGVPWVRGGMAGRSLGYFSVAPGNSACLVCRAGAYRAVAACSDVTGAAARLAARGPRVNRGIGPVAALLGSLVTLEVLRYLTGFEPPYAAGADVFVEVGGEIQQRREPWPADPTCPVCARAGRPDTTLVAR
jgi:molybdopterin/thiamine biosynthesis adenylyltransferase